MKFILRTCTQEEGVPQVEKKTYMLVTFTVLDFLFYGVIYAFWGYGLLIDLSPRFDK